MFFPVREQLTNIFVNSKFYRHVNTFFSNIFLNIIMQSVCKISLSPLKMLWNITLTTHVCIKRHYAKLSNEKYQAIPQYLSIIDNKY